MLEVFSTTKADKFSKESPYLNFRLHRCKAVAETGWDMCKNSDVADELARRPYYRSIQWVRCSYKGTNNGVLEIFSLYGVLGVRAFAPYNESYKFEPCGTYPYLGQTSLGMGTGCYGSWGYGFMSWGPNADFDDINTDFGAKPEDKQRDILRGWELKKEKM